MKNGQIDRVEAPTREEFLRNYMHKNRPVIITGVANRWGAFSKWDPEYLKSVAGDATVTAHYQEKGSFFDWYIDPPNRVDVEIKFAELVDRFANDPDGQQYFVSEFDLRKVSADLLRDIDFSEYFDSDQQPWEPQIFLGRNTCMPCHYHGKMEAFLCQFRGDKRIVLFSPDQYSRLYPGKWYKSIPLFSRIDARHIMEGKVDLDRFPKFRNATPLEFVLHPGEMLFIPLHWWHVTSVPGYQVSVTHFFKTKWRCWNFPSPGLQNIGREIVDGARNIAKSAKALLNRGARQSREA